MPPTGPTKSSLAADIPRVVIAGASSNVGKTTVTSGLIAALRQRGLTVQPFKCGPDYIDPSYHEQAAGRPCRNLDTWMLSDSQLLESFARACRGVDVAVVEGVMGLYDGSDWHDERGSTAQIAKLLDAPVLLVMDISGSARSAAAAALGYQNFDPAVALAGVILNFAGSERHARGCAEAIGRATGLPMFGWLPRELRLRIPERHLGLVPGGEQADSAALVEEMGAAVKAHFDVEGIVGVARRAVARHVTEGLQAVGPPIKGRASGRSATAGAPTEAGGSVDAGHGEAAEQGTQGAAPGARARPTVAVARDEAFCFYYPENLELLIEEGARIAFFSPLRGERLPANASGVYLGGGYPELHGPALAANMDLWRALRDLHAADAPIYAECGGFMVLTEALVDAEGRSWPMAGLLPGVTQMTGKLAALGYRHATALRANLLVEAGESLRGHEFRYSTWLRAAPGGPDAPRGADVPREVDAARGAGATTVGATAVGATAVGATAVGATAVGATVGDATVGGAMAGDTMGGGAMGGGAMGGDATAGDATAAWEARGTRADAPAEIIGYARGNLLASYLHVHFGQRRELARRFVQRLR